jgi:hypothetical protein
MRGVGRRPPPLIQPPGKDPPPPRAPGKRLNYQQNRIIMLVAPTALRRR